MSKEFVGHAVSAGQFTLVFGFILLALWVEKRRLVASWKLLVGFMAGLLVLTFVPEWIAERHYPDFKRAASIGSSMGLIGGLLWFRVIQFWKKDEKK